jgi:hypothetical protein
MSPRRQDTTFSLLQQSGPFQTSEVIPGEDLFSPGTRAWVGRLRKDNLTTRYRILREQIFELLNVSSYTDIQDLLNAPDKKKEVNRRAYGLLGKMFGIAGSEREIITTINGYSRTADGVIRYLRDRIFSNYAPFIEMTNEVDVTSSPVDLLFIIFDDRYHKKARFEAKRKLILMNLAGFIDQRERETEVEKMFTRFLSFLNEYVWSGKKRIGELDPVFLLSTHDKEQFSCQSARIISMEQAGSVEMEPGKKLTLIKRRHFHSGGRDIPIYVSIRKKPPEAKVLKLLRKGEENPAVAVDDELGLMGVLDSRADVMLFQKHLTECAIRAESFMTLEEISDTLSGNAYLGGNKGSSSQTPMFKFFARMNGMRVEFIIHTNKSYLNYIYQKNVAHDEYEVKRLFDTGVAELLFPRDIYYLEMEKIRDKLISGFRKRIEES